MALITCPKCGKQFSEHAKACPECGLSMDEAFLLIQEREEELRMADEQEARVRTEKRAAWWVENKKKVGILILVIAIIGIIGIIIKLAQPTANNSDSDNTQQNEQIEGNQEEVFTESADYQVSEESTEDDSYWDVLSTRKLTQSDLEGKTADELAIMRNSIYARHGYRFKKKKFLDYFGQFDWYQPSTDNQQEAYNHMSGIEQYNVNFIREHE